MAALSFQNLSRSFGDIRALDGVSADIPEGSFLALLGPSGCGKTTLLRLIAGLDRPDGGSLHIGETLVAGPEQFIGPEARGLGMVFQSYALWPHMTVAGNVAFGLNRLGRADRATRVERALHTVGLSDMAGRRPHELSGGQRQRVALARALAARPRVLLLDEPLANLDAHLRQQMLAEFRRIHAETGCTMVFVTHDQNEAMAVADLIGVMDRGQLMQLGSPQDLFQRPANEMVARFVGHGRTLPVTVVLRGTRRCRFMIGGCTFTLPGIAPPGPAWLCLHPSDLTLSTNKSGLVARVTDLRFEDGYQVAHLWLEDLPEAAPLVLRLDHPLVLGAEVRVTVRGGWVLPRAAVSTPSFQTVPA
ncbi:iron(III) transport system ATP-binding protein [Rhodobacter aestuarii]|uniref:Iron(III) transport system ATP-binding protein n=1 Tax=Rhodobacter aestuarii TaxID=453582 RepID=A0A1N7IXM6_9RHOB|nr:ABC transporter ATP-binding protein [Rhodobacter aestuarii]PTV97431.1 iron(III) transport system ATP-binding protein [Rhodobacter aestuarii]SIS41751.1 iron(III) transport system ATP-binding protein [Rhodobacter aestuarii]